MEGDHEKIGGQEMPTPQPAVFDYLWKAAAAVLVVLVGLLGYLFRRHFKRWDEDIAKLETKSEELHQKIEDAFTTLGNKVEGYRVSFSEGLAHDLRREIDEMKKEWADLRAHIPEHYLPRVDFIRDNTILDGKVSAMFRKFDRIEVKLDFLTEQISKGKASNA